MMGDFNDLVSANKGDRLARRRRARYLWLGGLFVTLVATATAVVHAGSDQSVRVAAAGADDSATTGSTDATATVTTTPPDARVTRETSSTTASSTSTTMPSTTSTTGTSESPPDALVVTTAPQQPDADQISLPAGGVMFPYEAGRNLWEATSNGFVIHVRIDDPAPVGGQVVRFSVDVSGPDGPCCEALVGYDGATASQLGRDGSICPSVPSNTFETSYVYNSAGLVHFKALAGECSWSKIGWLSGWLQVSQGQSSVQGPALPIVKTLGKYASPDHQGDTHYLPLFIRAQDDDGWIRQLIIDWGDDTTDTYQYNPFPCTAVAPSGWPATNYVSLPSDTTHPTVGLDGHAAPSTEHFYSTPATYKITVTVRSTACDGSQPQEGTSTMTWMVN
jgi:hypothetical protein